MRHGLTSNTPKVLILYAQMRRLEAAVARWGGQWEGTPPSVIFLSYMRYLKKRQEIKFTLRVPGISFLVLDSDDLFPLLV